MRGIAALCLTLLMACDGFVAGVKGGLLRIAVENNGDTALNLEISSVLEEKHTVQSPISSYSIDAASRTTLLHGFPCRRYGKDDVMSEFRFHAKPDFHCTFRARPGCGEYPVHLRCGNGGCTFEGLPWKVECRAIDSVR